MPEQCRHLDQAAANIPRSILLLRKIAQLRASRAAMFQVGGTVGAIALGRLMDLFDPHRVLGASYARRAYQDDVAAFRRFADKSLRQITLADLVAWGETLAEMAPASRARKLGAVKSLAASDIALAIWPSILAHRCGSRL